MKKKVISFAKSIIYGETLQLLRKMRLKKTSNDLYVLGSGSSINKINDWDEIASADSIGFNFWMIHNFVPTYYMLEAPRDEHDLAVMLKLLDRKKSIYKDCFFVLKSRKNSNLIEEKLLKHNLDYCKKSFFNFNSKDIRQLEINVGKYRSSFLRNIFITSQGVASVELIVVIGWLLGYERIVLCGIDLNNNDYFFKSSLYENEVMLLPRDLGSGSVQKTNNAMQCYGGIPVIDVLQMYQEKLLKKDCEIFVESHSSALAECFPVKSLS